MCSSSPAVLREANRGRGFFSPLLCYGDPRHTSGSPGSVIPPAIRSLGIPAHSLDLLAFQHAGHREPSPTAALCDSTARTVLTQHCWSCQVLGTHLDLPFLHFLQPSTAAGSSPSLSQGAALQEGGISVPCFPTTAKGKKQMQAHSLLFLQQLKSEPCPGTSPSASDKGDSSQHLRKLWQMSSPFPHIWDESNDLLLSCSKAQNLKYDQKKVQRSPSHQGICYARQADFRAPWHVCFQHGCKEKDDRETPVCFL